MPFQTQVNVFHLRIKGTCVLLAWMTATLNAMPNPHRKPQLGLWDCPVTQRFGLSHLPK
jgi:hypothetical protein